MNRFDEQYEFRLARLDETDRIMKFIYTYWSPNHILANDKAFFLYEFENGANINFFLAEKRDSGELHAIVGFYPYSRPMKEGISDFSGGLFQVRPDCRVPFLGMELLQRLFRYWNPRAYVGNGANPRTALPLHKNILKHYAGRLHQYYRLNTSADFKIAVVKHTDCPEITEKVQYDLKEFASAEALYEVFDDDGFKQRKPYKDRWYVEKRYFRHPIYRYHLYGVMGERVRTVLVGREIETGGSKVFRIVDVLGDCSDLAHAGKALDKILCEKQYEYMDFYEKGIDEAVLQCMGFQKREDEDDNIIPNYFEPFVQENIEIYYHSGAEDVCVFKADGDQDRPNHR